MLVFGIDRFAEVRADGSFIFTGLPPGKYDLRFVIAVDGYAALDSANIEVAAAETTVINGVVLPYAGIPVPRNLSMKYDTVQQKVTLSWTETDTSLIKGYTVFRRNVDSNTVFTDLPGGGIITGTVFRDISGLQDFTYEYRVAAIGKDGTTGPKGNGVTVRIASFFECDTQYVFGSGGGPGRFNSIDDVDISEEDELYFLDYENRVIQVFDTLMNFNRLLSLQDIPDSPAGCISDMCAGKSGNVYVIKSYEYFR